MNELRLTIKQIQEMQHALGNQIKKTSYRNYFNTGIDDTSWEELVGKGLASKRQEPEEMGGVYYHVTDEGIAALKQIMV